MGTLLWSYLGAHQPQAWSQEAKAINNPGNLHYRQNANSPVYALNIIVSPTNRPRLQPWGYAGNSTAPAKMLSLLGYSPQTTWAMQDIDQQQSVAQGASWASSLPRKPVNGNVRMTLFFDWHVAPVPVN
jgi:hypothetical protein